MISLQQVAQRIRKHSPEQYNVFLKILASVEVPWDEEKLPEDSDGGNFLGMAVENLNLYRFELQSQQEELEDSQQRIVALSAKYRDLFDLAPIPYFILDDRARIEEINLKGAEVLGVSRQEVSQRKPFFYRFLRREDASTFHQQWDRCLDQGTPMHLEVRTFSEGNSAFQILSGRMMNPTADGIRVLGSLTDITSQKKAHFDEVAGVRAFISSIGQNIPGLIYRCVILPDGQWVYPVINSGADNFFGDKKQLFQEDPRGFFQEYMPSAHYKHFQELTDGAIRDGGVRALEYSLNLPNEPSRWWRDVSRASRSERGEIIFDGVAIDISELKEARGTAMEAREKADQANLAQSQLVAVVSHEIRNPVHNMVGFAELIDPRFLPKEERDYLESILASGRIVSHLLDDILSYSRFDQGKVGIHNKEFRFSNLLDDFRRGVQLSLQEKGLELRVHCQDGLPEKLVGDPGKIHQILYNLVLNAIKHTHHGGVVVSFSGSSFPRSRYKIKVTVEDSGEGISPGEIKKIFEPFFQSSGENPEGLGLGLAICKKLCQSMDGDIAVSSVEGQGSKFEFTVKVGLPSVEVSTNEGEKMKGMALVVEDDPSSAFLLKQILKTLDLDSLIAGTGEKALELLETEAFDIVFMDIGLPGQSGIEATRKIRMGQVQEKVRKIPIIGMTAFVQAEFREEGLKAGMSRFLHKPLQKRLISQVIKEVLG